MSARPAKGWRLPRIAALCFAALAFALAAFAAAAPILGLGTGENFPSHALFGLARRAFFFAALAAALCGLALAALFWALDAAPGRVAAVLANLALVLGSVLLSLGALEAGLRLAHGIPVFSWQNFLAERNALLTTQTLNAYDPLLGWVLREGQRLSPDSAEGSFTTGRRGVRLSAPDGRQPAPGGILAVGDSFTAGSEVGDRHAWPAHLERLLGEQVINAATGGWGADQIVLRAEQLLDEFAPKLVIVSFLDDDIGRAGFRVYGGANKPYFTVADGALVHHHNPVPLYRGTVAETPAYLLAPSYSYLFQWATDRLGVSDWWRRASVAYVRVDNDPVEVSCLLLRRLKRLADARGARMLFLMQYPGHPSHDRIERHSHAVRVLGCAREAGIRAVDLWVDLVAARRRGFDEYTGLWVSFDGTSFGHMSGAGNLLVAERLARELRQGR